MVFDPEMLFIESEDMSGNKVYDPISYKNAGMCIECTSVELVNEEIQRFIACAQKWVCVFR